MDSLNGTLNDPFMIQLVSPLRECTGGHLGKCKLHHLVNPHQHLRSRTRSVVAHLIWSATQLEWDCGIPEVTSLECRCPLGKIDFLGRV